MSEIASEEKGGLVNVIIPVTFSLCDCDFIKSRGCRVIIGVWLEFLRKSIDEIILKVHLGQIWSSRLGLIV